jgi:hypothetical protein
MTTWRAVESLRLRANSAHMNDATSAPPSDWDITAIHEAAHVEVGIRMGWELVSASLVPPITQFAPTRGAIRKQVMTYFSAGHLAEEILKRQPTQNAFDATLRAFFEKLGDADCGSVKAHSMAAKADEDDVYELACLIDSYSTRARGCTQFRQARLDANRLLTDNWSEVQERARTLQREARLSGDAG